MKTLYNNSMKKKEIAYHLKGRWKGVYEIEMEELRNIPFEVRFLQTASLMGFADFLGWPERTVEERQNIRKYWKKVRDKA